MQSVVSVDIENTKMCNSWCLAQFLHRIISSYCIFYDLENVSSFFGTLLSSSIGLCLSPPRDVFNEEDEGHSKADKANGHGCNHQLLEAAEKLLRPTRVVSGVLAQVLEKKTFRENERRKLVS